MIGIPKEFYLAFFYYLGDDLVNCLNRNFEMGELTPSQRQAIITLIAKPGKDKRHLKSWRPISLSNVDVKLLSLILASRIKNVLPKLINSEQSAFVKNLYIGESIRQILDVLHYTDDTHQEAIMFAADFEAAFDSLDHTFMLGVLKKFGFNENFIKWISLL